MYLLFIDYEQNVRRKVQRRQFATRIYSLCMPGLLAAISIHVIHSAHSCGKTQMIRVNYLRIPAETPT